MKQTLQGRKLLEKVANTKVMSAEEKIQEQARLLETLHTELTTFNNIIL